MIACRGLVGHSLGQATTKPRVAFRSAKVRPVASALRIRTSAQLRPERVPLLGRRQPIDQVACRLDIPVAIDAAALVDAIPAD